MLPAAPAADIEVPADVPTVQGAIDLAVDGDRILVGPGVWAGPIDFDGKSLELASIDGAEVTVLDGGEQTGYVVTIAGTTGDGASLRGFTVRGGRGSAGSDGLGPGGGVRVDGGSALLESLIVVDNTGIEGAGIAIVDAEATVRDTRVAGNEARTGGGLFATTSTLTVEDSVLEDNLAVDGGGLAAVFDVGLTLRSVRVAGNVASQLGGGLYLAHVAVNGTDLDLVGNGEATVHPGGTILFNTLGGGGMYTANVDGRLDRVRVVDKRGASGGGVYVAGGGSLELVNTLVARNLAANGAVYCNASSPRLLNPTMADNDTLIGLFTTFNAEPLVENSALSNPTAATGGNGLVTVRFSLIDGGLFSSMSGGGVIDGDPMLDPDADYAPLPGSPVIDAGDGLALPEDIALDLLGNVRAVDDPNTPDGGNGPAPVVDLGAIEFGSSGPAPFSAADMDGDGAVGLGDLLMVLSDVGPCGGCPSDLDGDGVVGFADVLLVLANWADPAG